MKIFENRILCEKYYFLTLDSGMKVYLIPKKGYKHYFAILGVPYGSFSYQYKINDIKYCDIKGLAHFLEHKNFATSGDTDVSNTFASLGADVNAFTSYLQTCYYFSTTSNFEKCLKLLIDFILTPYFTTSNVEKEKGIIEQELLMGLDRDYEQLITNLYKLMYSKNPIRYDIGGSVEEIKRVTVDDLNNAYRYFYHPANMTLVVTGDFEVDTVMKLLDGTFKNKSFSPYTFPSIIYEREVFDKKIKEKELPFDLNIPKMAFGLKLSASRYSTLNRFKISIYLDILLDMYFGDSSLYYQEWKRKELVDYSFSFEAFFEKEYAFVEISSNTSNPLELKEEVKRVIDTIRTDKIDADKFNHYLKIQKARTLKRFNNIDSIAEKILDFSFSGLNYLEMVDVLDDLRFSDLPKIQEFFDSHNLYIFTLNPFNKNSKLD